MNFNNAGGFEPGIISAYLTNLNHVKYEPRQNEKSNSSGLLSVVKKLAKGIVGFSEKINQTIENRLEQNKNFHNNVMFLEQFYDGAIIKNEEDRKKLENYALIGFVSLNRMYGGAKLTEFGRSLVDRV